MRKDAQEKNEGPLTSKIAQICPLMLSRHSLSPTHSEAWGTAARDEEGCGTENILKLQGLDRAGLTHLRSTWACPMAPGPQLIRAGESDCMTGGPGCELVGAEVASGQNS